MVENEFVISGAQLDDGSHRDLFISEGRFVESVGMGARRIDADGLIALPGLVDPHTHLREPGGEAAETIESGTRAAARGGYTTVMAMPNTTPAIDSVAAAEWIFHRGAEVGSAQVGVIGAITKGREGRELSDITGMANSTARVRMFSDDGSCLMDAELMRQALEAVKPFRGVVAQHAQDADLAPATACAPEGPSSEATGLPTWPRAAESAIIARDAELAQLTGSRVHVCHVSTAEGVEVLRWAKSRGLPISAEVTPHHLLLGTNLLQRGDATFKVNPPLRYAEDRKALVQALADGTIDMVGTDHAPHTEADKNQPLPQAKPGMTGLEQALGVLIEVMVKPGYFGWSDIARVMSANPAWLAGLRNQGGRLRVGEEANLVLIDPARHGIIDPEASLSKARNNPYAGLDLPDPVQLTMWAGRVTYSR
jgi:dihydroorotase